MKTIVTVIIAILMIQTGISLAQPPDEHTIAYWKLDEGTGTFVADSSQYGNNGTVENATWTTDAKTGGFALEFNGQDSQVTVADSPSLHPSGGNITIGAWIKVFSDPTGWPNGGAIVYKGSAYQWIVNTDGYLWLGIWGGRLTSTGTYDMAKHLNEWHHVATTFDDATKQGQIYVDGELNVEGAIAAAIDQTTNELYLGYKADGGGRFDGIIDEVRISDVVRSQDDIQASMLGSARVPFSRDPNPEDGAILESTWANLSWKPGDFAVSHDMYFGTNFDDVNDGVEGTFAGNIAGAFQVVGFVGYPAPDGLQPGTTYYWRIDEVNDANAASPWKGEIWSFFVPPRTAYQPAPADGQGFVASDVTLTWKAGYDAKLHNVYFGDDLDQVSNATGAMSQADATFTPGTLEMDKTYYWRVDEFDGATTHKGDVWSFTTLPVIAPAADPNLLSWWTFDEGMGQTALDWSGHGNNLVLFGPGWITPGILGDAAINFKGSAYAAIQNLTYAGTDYREVTVSLWIRTESGGNQYIVSFDRNEYWRLSINLDGVGQGQIGWHVMTNAGQVDLSSTTRVDDGLWHHVCGVFDNGQVIIYIDGQKENSLFSGISFGTGNIRFGLLGANSEATSFNGAQGTGSPIAGDIDDMRIYDRALTQEEIVLLMRGDPKLAWDPTPGRNAIVDIRDISSLSWEKGDTAVSHDVYFGTDGNALEFKGNQTGTSLSLTDLVEFGGGDYYWLIDEVEADGTVNAGTVWKFTVPDYLIVDDFESYNDINEGEEGSNRIYNTWIDGYGTTTNGSQAGNLDPPFMSPGHSGAQAMPLSYDNAGKTSEATRTLVSKKDWTEQGVTKLVIWFSGNAANAPDRMFVALNGNAVVYHDDADVTQTAGWTEWVIDLQEFADQGVDLTNVGSITIGFGTRNTPIATGGTGTVDIDDIRLIQ